MTLPTTPQRFLMARFTDPFTLALVVGLALTLPHGARAQQTGSVDLEPDAVDATLAAVHYSFVQVDSIESVSWPSGKTLLARRPGIVALSGISIRFREDPARAIALTDRIAAALNLRGITARTILPSDARYCGTGNTTHCSLPDALGLLLLVGYPYATEQGQIVKITMVTDSSVRSGRPVISLDISLRKMSGTWTVTRVARTTGFSD